MIYFYYNFYNKLNYANYANFKNDYANLWWGKTQLRKLNIPLWELCVIYPKFLKIF